MPECRPRGSAQHGPTAADRRGEVGHAVTSAVVECAWCGVPVVARRSGGKRQRFCRPDHRTAFHSEARRRGARALALRATSTLATVAELGCTDIPEPKMAPAHGWRWRALLAIGWHPCG